MSQFHKFDSFVADLAHKVHNLESDKLEVALSNTEPKAYHSKLSDIAQIGEKKLSSRLVSTIRSEQKSGTYKLILADLTLTAAAEVELFRYVVLFNSDNKKLIGWCDYGKTVGLNSGESFTISFDREAGAIQLA